MSISTRFQAQGSSYMWFVHKQQKVCKGMGARLMFGQKLTGNS